MKKTTAAIWLAATLAALLGVAPAAAKPKAKPKQPVTFELEIEGEQLTTWKYIKDTAPTCDWPESAQGRQYISFETYESGGALPRVKAKAAPGGGVELTLLRKDVRLSAGAELERSQDILYGAQTPCPGGGNAGGEVQGPDVHEKAKCKGVGDLDLFLGSSLAEVESPSYPTDLAKAKPPRAPIYFAADPYWVNSDASDHNLPAACVASGMPNADIGVTESQGEWAGALVPVAGSLPAAKLLSGKSKVTVVHLGRSIKYPNPVQTYGGPPHTTGRTRIDLTLTLRRLH